MSNFSDAAKTYDTDFTFSAIGIYQRERVWKEVRKYFEKENVSVLEMNCGTGIDATIMKSIGCNVLATDASEEMINVARQNRIEGVGVDIFIPSKDEHGTLDFEVASFDELKQKVAGKKFDVVFSNFGGLNCIDKNQLEHLTNDLSNMLNENGKLILVFMAPKCIWEKKYFLLKGNFKNISRRENKEGAETIIGEKHFKTWFYKTSEIEKICNQKFTVIKRKPIALFVPPSYMEKFFSNKKVLLSLLNVFDNIFSFSFLSNYADHYLIVLQKTNKA